MFRLALEGLFTELVACRRVLCVSSLHALRKRELTGLVIADLHIPSTTPSEVLEFLEKHQAQTPILAMSADWELVEHLNQTHRGFPVIKKHENMFGEIIEFVSRHQHWLERRHAFCREVWEGLADYRRPPPRLSLAASV